MGGAGPTVEQTGPGGLIVKELVAGSQFTCALTSLGRVKCWGNNAAGAVGSGDFENQTAAIDVAGLSEGIKRIAAGGRHACAITKDDELLCWGVNLYGELDAAPQQVNHAVSLSGYSGTVSAIGAGILQHSCLIAPGGSVRCWGANAKGQLGASTPSTSADPLVVSALTGYSAVVAGNDFTCGLTNGGAVNCWGGNQRGQLGRPDDNTGSASPVAVTGLGSGVKSLGGAGLSFACVLMDDDGVQCWGSNNAGTLGNGAVDCTLAPSTSYTPAYVTGLTSGVKDLATSNSHSCVVMKDDGQVLCWGFGGNGELGSGAGNVQACSSTPFAVPGMTGAILVAAGELHTCAAMASGGVKCWGSGRALGTNRSENQGTPVAIPGL